MNVLTIVMKFHKMHKESVFLFKFEWSLLLFFALCMYITEMISNSTFPVSVSLSAFWTLPPGRGLVRSHPSHWHQPSGKTQLLVCKWQDSLWSHPSVGFFNEWCAVCVVFEAVLVKLARSPQKPEIICNKGCGGELHLWMLKSSLFQAPAYSSGGSAVSREASSNSAAGQIN